jgi:hypothetical protein
MADFRKWILALSVLALVFTGVASAQITGGEGTAITCVAGTAVPPQLRTEGYTELVGDITLVCTGGTAPALGAVIPQANIVVQLPGTITSRLIGTGTAAASEALLMIDEPGASKLSGFGPAQPQTLCTTPSIGCQAWVNAVPDPTNFGAPVDVGVIAPGSTTPAPNVYMGITSGSQVTFFGVPVLAPVSSNVARVIRITNVRVNANGITGGGSGFQSVLAQISVNNVQVSVTNPTVTVGYIQQSFQGSFRNGTNAAAVATSTFYQCQPQINTPVAFLRFSELFGTAFKTRVNGANGGSGTGYYPLTVSSTQIQNIPGAIYNSESGFVSNFGATTTLAAASKAGLADYGTRLKAVFSNLPAGVSVYVATVNDTDGTTPTGGAAAGTGVVPAPAGSPELAYLVNTEVGVDPFTAVTATIPNEYLLVPSSTGSATAVWEVVQTLPNTIENYDFGVYITYANNISPVSGITATLSYAPTPTVPFSASAAAQASSSLTIPRFAIAASASGTSFLNISLCNTALLFPYVTTAMLVAGESGFDTGISIANTTSDPFGTTNQAGTCSLYWYGGVPGATGATATNPQTSSLGAGGVNSSVPIISGTTALTLASQSVPSNWSGYMIALCNFQFAHGYASVTDVGVRNIMASYLALVINSGNGGVQRANSGAFAGALFSAPEGLEN